MGDNIISNVGGQRRFNGNEDRRFGCLGWIVFVGAGIIRIDEKFGNDRRKIDKIGSVGGDK